VSRVFTNHNRVFGHYGVFWDVHHPEKSIVIDLQPSGITNWSWKWMTLRRRSTLLKQHREACNVGTGSLVVSFVLGQTFPRHL
jgi:hypothetical protein